MLRATLALFALAAVRAQPTSTWVEVAPASEELEDLEKRYTPELVEELSNTKQDALLLYTEYSARSGGELKVFLKNISGLTNQTLDGLDRRILDNAPHSCRTDFEKHLKKIEYDAHRAASFSAENHHKFLLGHMIVFRMHLNKSEEYLRKCVKLISTCGIQCETMPKVIRWRRQAMNEIQRVRDDMEHSRKSYRDIVTHAHRKLNSLRKVAATRAQNAVQKLVTCSQG